MTDMKVKLSKGNTKMGTVLSVSLAPIKSCGAALPCFKSCYAAKLSRLRPLCRAAWDGNWKMAMARRDQYMAQIKEAILKQLPAMFRWHVAGDIPDKAYLLDIIATAYLTPATKHLVFTKKYDLLSQLCRVRLLPTNLSIVMSAWPGLELPKPLLKKFPVAYMKDPKDPDKRIPESAVQCDGGCTKCGLCWRMKAGESTFFLKH